MSERTTRNYGTESYVLTDRGGWVPPAQYRRPLRVNEHGTPAHTVYPLHSVEWQDN
jgi:hypothetical protein